jgi:hypothetical protein
MIRNRAWLLLDSRVVASFAFAVAMIFQDNPARARPSPWNPIRASSIILREKDGFDDELICEVRRVVRPAWNGCSLRFARELQ